MKYILIPLVIAVCAILIFVFVSKHSVKITTAGGAHHLFVDLAENSDEKAAGLMGRDSLPEWKGMLFLYDNDAAPDFWMKNMLIPIDIIFIDADHNIKHIAESVPPCEAKAKCELYNSGSPIRYVLEVKAGYSKKYGVAIGDKVLFWEL